MKSLNCNDTKVSRAQILFNKIYTNWNKLKNHIKNWYDDNFDTIDPKGSGRK